MISKEEIKKLADLARIEVGDKEAENLGSEMESILEYVGQVKSITTKRDAESPPLVVRGAVAFAKVGGVINIMREDQNPTESGNYSKELIDEFPNKDGDYLKVKKIL